MSIKHVIGGLTYTMFFNFFGSGGLRTSVDSPTVDIFNPQKNRIITSAELMTTELSGKYRYDYYATTGLTPGNYFAVAVGLTDNNTLFSPVNTFEVIDYISQAEWVGLEELREYLQLEDDDRDEDENLKTALNVALELVEGYTHRRYGIYQYDETLQIYDTDRVKLKHFPINQIVAVTPSFQIIPRSPDSLLTETIVGSQVGFYYRLDAENGILYLTDQSGFEYTYDTLLLGISYLAGFATIPEPVRQAVLSLAATLHNLSCSEGIEYLKFSDINFAMTKSLFDGHIGEMLADYKNNFQV